MLFVRYFQCEPKYGLFAPAHKIKKIADGPPATESPSQSQTEQPTSLAPAEERATKTEVSVSILVTQFIEFSCIYFIFDVSTL